MNNNKCVICGTDSNQAPLIKFDFKGKEFHICTQHIPVLIHKANQLGDILPGMENVENG